MKKSLDIVSLKDLVDKCSAKQRFVIQRLPLIERPAKQRFVIQRLPLIERQVDTSTLMKLGGKSEKIRLPSFISHPNGNVFRAFKRQRSMIETKKISGPKFICHPNGMVLKVLNQQLRPRK